MRGKVRRDYEVQGVLVRGKERKGEKLGVSEGKWEKVRGD